MLRRLDQRTAGLDFEEQVIEQWHRQRPTRWLPLRCPTLQNEAFRKDQTHDLCSPCAYGHADPDLGGTQNHGIREHSVDTAERQLQGNDGKQRGEHRNKTALRSCALNHR